MMLSRDDFEGLLSEHQQLVDLANDVELCLYRLGDAPPDERVAECRQAAGTLIGVLRSMLFRQDQVVLPLLDRMTEAVSASAAQ